LLPRYERKTLEAADSIIKTYGLKVPKPLSSVSVTPALTEVAEEEETKGYPVSQSCIIQSDPYQRLKAKFRAFREHHHKEMRTITEQLSEL